MMSKECRDCFHFYGVAEDMNGEIGMCELQSSEYPNYKVAGETACKMFNAPTVFNRITASPEVLAPKFVYFAMADEYGRDYWGSSLLDGQFWKTEKEAIAATVAKLKEVCDE